MIAVFIVFILLILNIENSEFDSKSLKLGVSIPKSGIMHAVGDAVYAGATAYFLHAEQNKLLGDVKVKLIVYDDKYEPELTVENTKILIDKNVFAFLVLLGLQQ